MFKEAIFDLVRKKKERFPELLSIELSSVCNAKCIMCPHVSMDRRKQHMDMEILEKNYCRLPKPTCQKSQCLLVW